ncbi:hypothetical protein LINGRAHAP2_LOCUS14266 [Linum grandiflorum]
MDSPSSRLKNVAGNQGEFNHGDAQGNDLNRFEDVIGHLIEYSETFKSSGNPQKDIEIKLREGSQLKVTLWARPATQFDELIDAHGDKGIILIITSTLYFNLEIPEVLNFMGFLVKVNVQDATVETKFVIFDYEGNIFFKLSASELYDHNGNSHNTTPELMVQLLVD